MKAYMIRVFVLFVSCLTGFIHGIARAEEFGDFSFIVFGDSRLPGYFPYKDSQLSDIELCFEETRNYAFGPDVAFEREYSFDPESGELDWFKIWPTGAPDKYLITVLKNGWPRLMLRGPGANIVLRSEGQAWVYKTIISRMHSGADDTLPGPTFCLHTGDITYFGYFGTSMDKSPFWSDFHDRFMSKLPAENPEGLPGRFFPSPGNHETWLDENLEGFTSTVPYLEEMGFTLDNRVYMFDYQGCRFIFLDTGDMDYRNPSEWGGKNPGFDAQMDSLTNWLTEAVEIKSREVFITFHNPAFCQAGFGPIPEDHNPHSHIEPFSSDLNITVFTGHVHTTELYEVDGVRYLVLGAGGGEQELGTTPQADDYPLDLYWKGGQRVEDYNFLEVFVAGEELQFTLHRYRPEAETKYEIVEVYK